jgi:hypothetical protein
MGKNGRCNYEPDGGGSLKGKSNGYTIEETVEREAASAQNSCLVMRVLTFFIMMGMEGEPLVEGHIEKEANCDNGCNSGDGVASLSQFDAFREEIKEGNT